MALTNLETWINDRIEWLTPRHAASLRRAVNADIKEARRGKGEENMKTKLSEIRQAFADYVRSEGCSCCCDIDGHDEAAKRLGKLLCVKKYSDGSGYDFYSYSSKDRRTKS